MARKTCTLFRLSLVEKEERQNSSCGVNFSQKSKRMGALFCRGRRSVPSIIFCVKFEEPAIFLGVLSSQKCHRKASLVLRRTEIRFLLLFCEKCEVPKNFRIFGISFPISVDFPNDQCTFNTDVLAQMFFRRNVKTPLGDRL